MIAIKRTCKSASIGIKTTVNVIISNEVKIKIKFEVVFWIVSNILIFLLNIWFSIAIQGCKFDQN